jgi:hypothetical protein
VVARESERARGVTASPRAHTAAPLHPGRTSEPVGLLGLQRAAGNAAVATWAAQAAVQRQPETLVLSPSAFPQLRLPERAIEGPLPAGTVIESHGLTVTQRDEGHVEIIYGRSSARISAEPGERYVFAIGPPIEQPPRPQTTLLGPITLPGPDAVEELPQRLVRVSSTRNLMDATIDDTARVAPLAVQTRYASPADLADGHATAVSLDVQEWCSAEHATLQLEDSLISIDADPRARGTDLPQERPAFAYWIDPEWTGPQATERRVVIVAAPGVRVRTGSPAHSPVAVYGRKLVDDVVRVPHRQLVPEQGTRFDIAQFVGVDVVDPGDAAAGWMPFQVGEKPPRDRVQVGTGMAGVTIQHSDSGARVRLAPSDPAVGAAYAWQVVPPANGAPGEIRVVVGPGVTVDVAEPVPARLRDPHGGSVPTPNKRQAGEGEGWDSESFSLRLIEVPDPAQVPVQGTPLNIDHLLSRGAAARPADRHAWLGTDDLAPFLATIAADLIISMVPIVGPLYMIGNAALILSTGQDVWGNEYDAAGKTLAGIGAALSLIPLVGGLGAILRGGPKTAVLAEFAAKWGTTPEELKIVLARVGAATEGNDAQLVQKALRSLAAEGHFAEEDLPALRRLLARVGAGELGLPNIAKSATGQLELAIAAGRNPISSEEYLVKLTSAYRMSGAVPERYAAALVRSGHFGNGEEAAAAIEQALRDLARAENVVADESLILGTAARTGTVFDKILPAETAMRAFEPAAMAEARRLIAAATAEETAVTAVLQDVATHSEARLVGLENVIKSPDSLAEKLTREAYTLASNPSGLSTEEAIAKASEKTKDVLRYTVQAKPDRYMSTYRETESALRSRGYARIASKNTWAEPGSTMAGPYRGINETWKTPGGQRFEVQFHTPESYELKTATHEMYEELRDAATSSSRQKELIREMTRLSDKLPVPKGAVRRITD